MVTNGKSGSFSGEAWLKGLQRPVHIAPLVMFRILFGLMMFASMVRFWMKGWITELYVKPSFYFPYPGFEWVRPLGETGMHLLFALIALSALLVALGLFYRVAITLFFLTFTYVELIDSTNYLNHYYFISLVSFLLIWLPANRYFSLDVRLNPEIRQEIVPRWIVGVFRLQLGMVYIFAGIAKLNPDWLLEALPLKIWLPAKSHLPIIGNLMYEAWVAYLFSWFGAIYDLFIVFFLLNRKTRPVAYGFVLLFHLATAIFFPGIGMFPYVMIVSSLVFFHAGFHQKIIAFLSGLTGRSLAAPSYTSKQQHFKPYLPVLLGIYFLLQAAIPFRYLLYPGHLFWNEEGFRFSWRVMLMEKSGNTFFYVKEPSTGKTYEVSNSKFLTPLQEKMMSTQPDMILQYAHFLAETYAQRGIKDPEVYVECFVALNGERSRLFVDKTVNLAKQSLGWNHYNWVLPYRQPE
ncbi:HTTM domain-containing protein [Adhaeribacter soli]|uniref:HTTM domain-containing protein n=1 Tax=Adhaeribacter soli TaxID=2607655 RepID=A0A5N1ILT2_9BACT|nr:HTTM domain-containing protein [Adhaeribacter soli]KAA9327427.1 HTTM domain-containing protein [Adhaeribacter soli]